MLYIAFDQATVVSGYSVYKDRDLIDYGKFKHEGEINQRISKTVQNVLKVIKTYKDKYPEEKLKVVIEDIQLQQGRNGNTQTFKQLAQLQGAVIVAVLDNFQQVPDIYYSSSWKSFNKITGRARAEQKRNAQKKVEELHGIRVTQDEADAILLGRYASHKELNWD